ncbi:MAG TPA: histidine triad nucleotide-binding protein [Desulfobacterales bacterium]|nr:histidine triad nucleotide-binding protein [Desulfobacterales bacterium]
MEKNCLFCRIISGQAPAEFVYENDVVVVFKDIYPKAPVHLLIVPKKHIRSINELSETDREIVSEMILTAKEIAKKNLISTTGYKLFFNVERGGGQEIFHLHLHLIGGWI